MVQIIMAVLGYCIGINRLAKGLGYLPFKKSLEMSDAEVTRRKHLFSISGLALFGIGVVYTLSYFGGD
ncbi:hypothetical protein [Alishewanella sp. HL-SH06]|uniref:hypothetical protein n=1 Tax=Alishewanella sp. HL-SH06 TaxID=3461144 RepID=UPI004042BD15